MENYKFDCDRCAKVDSVDATHEGNAVTLMLNQGWKFWEDEQFCPECYSELSEPYAEAN
jgi:hypothetical protein